MLRSIRDILKLAGRGSVRIAFFGLVSALGRAAIETIFPFLIVLVLVESGLMDIGRLPRALIGLARGSGWLVIWMLLFAVGVARAAFHVVARQTGFFLRERVEARLRLVHGYEILEEERDNPVVMSRVNATDAETIPRAAEYVFASFDLLTTLVEALALVAGMALLAWREALVGLVGSGLITALVLLFNRKVKVISGRIAAQREILERTLVRISRNWLLIRVLHLKNHEYPLYVRSVMTYARLGLRSLGRVAITGAVPSVLALFVLGLLMSLRQYVFHTPSVVLVAFVYLFFRFSQIMAGSLDRLALMNRLDAPFRQAMAMMEKVAPSAREVALAPERETPWRLFGGRDGSVMLPDKPAPRPVATGAPAGAPEIEARGITVSWPDSGEPVFRDLSFRIPAGTQFGLVGPSGSGKSTLLAVLLGVLHPSEGDIRISDRPAGEFTRGTGAVGYVGADSGLIHGTIRENLLYGAERPIGDPELLEMLHRVRLDLTAMAPHRTLDSEILENGDGLSSGEKQRLAMARALLRKPILLLLDEATANCDARLEDEIADVLAGLRGKTTIVIAAHRPGILRGTEVRLDLGGRS